MAPSRNAENTESYQHNGVGISLPSLKEEENENDIDEPERMSSSTTSLDYDWQLFVPAQKTMANLFRWIIVGGAAKAALSEDHAQNNLRSLARCIILVREYGERFGMPRQGGPKVRWLACCVLRREKNFRLCHISHILFQGPRVCSSRSIPRLVPWRRSSVGARVCHAKSRGGIDRWEKST